MKDVQYLDTENIKILLREILKIKICEEIYHVCELGKIGISH